MKSPETDRTSTWMADIVRHVEQSEYHVSWHQRGPIPGFGGGYVAPNRGQNLRFAFVEEGLLVTNRVAPTWVLGLSTSSVAAGGRPVLLGNQAPAVSDNEVVYHHAGTTLTLTNRPNGLDYALRIDGRPGPGDAMAVAFELTGDVHYRVLWHDTAEIRNGTEAVLRFASLTAADVLGTKLSVSFGRSDSGGLEATVDVGTAVFPVTLEGTLKSISTSADFLIDEGLAVNHLGHGVETAGDVNGDGYSDVLVGIPGFDDGGGPDTGKVQVYHGGPNGLGSPATKSWTVVGPQAGSRFGNSVATAGDVNRDGYSDVIVGAPGYNAGGGGDGDGAVFAYHGSESGLSTTEDWYREGDQAHSNLGFCVATAGDVNGDGYSDVIVSRPFHDANGYSDVGQVLVYLGGTAGLGPSTTFYPLGGQDGEQFGLSVATAGDVNGDGYADVVVGAPLKDHASYTDAGEVRVYLGSSSGPSMASYTVITQDSSDLRLGIDVSTAGDVNGDGYADVIVGSMKSLNVEGAAFLYRGNGSGIDTFYLWSAEGGPGDSLGSSVATAGDVNGDGYADVIVGASFAGPSGKGRAFVWLGGSGGLGANGTPSNAYWTGEADPTDGYAYGMEVAPAGDVNGDGYSDIIVADPLLGLGFEGRVYGYYGGPDNLADTPGWTFDSGQQSAQAGVSVATAGDVNGDGYADFIIGAEYYDYTFNNEGAAFVWYGTEGGPSFAGPDWWVYGGRNDARLGHSVATAGDVNGDGFSDIIVGAPGWANPTYNEGAAFVFTGGASGINGTTTSTAAWKAEIDDYIAEFGWSVGTAGDVNGDGYADVVIGAPVAGASSQGAAFVWRGSATGLGPNGTPANADWDWYGSTAGGRFGQSVGTAGDVNRDDYSDLIVGGDEVAVVWHGSSAGLSSSSFDWSYASASMDDNDLGISVGTAGDVGGDGYSDVVVGAPKMDSTMFVSDDGAVLVFCGGGSGLGAGPCFTDYGNADGALLGSSVATAGDLNGDGMSDVVAGARHWSSGHTWEGQARVYYGSIFGLWSADWTHESDQTYSYLGHAVGTAGDVNGDGYADLLVGAPAYNNTYTGEGRVSLFFGSDEHGGGSGGRHRLTQQLSPSGQPIAPRGMSTSENGIRFYHRLSSPATGRGRFAVQSEVKVLGAPLDGSNLHTTMGYDSGIWGAAFLQDLAVLITGREHHWRSRVWHSAVTNPFDPPRGRWVHIGTFGMNEAHLRAAGSNAPQDHIFSDGFESGNFSGWSSHVN